MACGYKLTAEKQSPTDPNTWVDNLAIFLNTTTESVSPIELYIASLYFSASVITLSSTSFQPLQPTIAVEWGYVLFCSLVGYTLLVYVVSNLTDLNVYANKEKRLHELRLDKYLEMFHNLYINPGIKFKVHEYLNDQFALSSESEYQSLIKALPQQWNGLINMEIFLPFLNRIPFLEPFIDIEPNLMIELCRNIEMMAQPPNSLLFQGGIKGIYLLEKGIVAIDGKIFVR